MTALRKFGYGRGAPARMPIYIARRGRWLLGTSNGDGAPFASRVGR